MKFPVIIEVDMLSRRLREARFCSTNNKQTKNETVYIHTICVLKIMSRGGAATQRIKKSLTLRLCPAIRRDGVRF
jgi:hypothetical protein